MSIKKCIMNYFDKATNAMIPFHPQTESGAITDWHESIIGSLASKVLPTVVSELTTDSVLGKLMKMLLTASGVKYSIDTNGYVCLGSFFGGLIIQWGYETDISSKEKYIPLPIAYPTTGLSLAVAVTGWETLCSTDGLTTVNFRYRGNRDVMPNLRWISLGY